MDAFLTNWRNKMAKIDTITKWVRSNSKDYSSIDELAKAVESRFNVGVYIDACIGFAPTRPERLSHALEIWFIRSGQWIKPAGWVSVMPSDLKQLEK